MADTWLNLSLILSVSKFRHKLEQILPDAGVKHDYCHMKHIVREHGFTVDLEYLALATFLLFQWECLWLVLQILQVSDYRGKKWRYRCDLHVGIVVVIIVLSIGEVRTPVKKPFQYWPYLVKRYALSSIFLTSV